MSPGMGHVPQLSRHYRKPILTQTHSSWKWWWCYFRTMSVTGFSSEWTEPGAGQDGMFGKGSAGISSPRRSKPVSWVRNHNSWGQLLPCETPRVSLRRATDVPRAHRGSSYFIMNLSPLNNIFLPIVGRMPQKPSGWHKRSSTWSSTFHNHGVITEVTLRRTVAWESMNTMSWWIEFIYVVLRVTCWTKLLITWVISWYLKKYGCKCDVHQTMLNIRPVFQNYYPL